MSHRLRVAAGLLTAASICAGALAARAEPQKSYPAAAPDKAGVQAHAAGTFDVKVNPLPAYDTTEGSMLGRMSIDKKYHGDLEGTGTGEMLTAMTEDKDSGGYVAVERVTGTLQGHKGTFE